ncbi:MAG: hypothetical protein IJ315_06265 [Firmicutes bacterium]|nr:hypothetical protein [Bacillota bacterium]
MKSPVEWGNNVFIVLIASVFLAICKGGFFAIYIVWGIYLADGWKALKRYPSDAGENIFIGRVVLGIIVCVLVTIISIVVAFSY